MTLTASTAAPGCTATDLTRRLVEGPDAAAAGVEAETVPAVTLTPVGDTVIDRGYSEAVPEEFHPPAAQAGVSPGFDLHKTRRGVTSRHRGAVVAFGNLHSPGILNYPDLLRTDQTGAYAPWEEWQPFFADAAAREKFRLHRNGGPDDDGCSRHGCPAKARGATVGCVVRGTDGLVVTKNLLEVFVPPAAPLPDVCTTTWLTIAPDITARSMDLEWGSEAWYNSFVRRRPRVEGTQRHLEKPAFSALVHMTSESGAGRRSDCSSRSPTPSPTYAPPTGGAPNSPPPARRKPPGRSHSRTAANLRARNAGHHTAPSPTTTLQAAEACPHTTPKALTRAACGPFACPDPTWEPNQRWRNPVRSPTSGSGTPKARLGNEERASEVATGDFCGHLAEPPVGIEPTTYSFRC
jgi:hypothetical protein